jgi:serum/glucocorticoid-regulated kinase 2
LLPLTNQYSHFYLIFTEKDAFGHTTSSSLSTTPIPSRSNTPKPSSHDTMIKQGVLTVRVHSGRNFNLPPGVPLPAVIQQVLANGAPHIRGGGSNRESLQRKRSWWLPYVVLSFDKQEILIDALGGEMHAPAWMYKADL